MTRPRRLVLIACLALEVAVAACGKRGNPLAPIRKVPAPVANLAARRVGDQVELRFNIPAENTDASTPPLISRVEIYAAAGPPTLAAAAPMSIAPFALAIPIGETLTPVPSTPLALSRFQPIQLSDPSGAAPAARGKVKPAATTAGDILNKKYLRGQIEVRPAPAPDPEGAQPPDAAPAPAAPASTPVVEDPRPQPGWITTFSEQVTREREAAAQAPDVSILRYVIVGVAGGKRLGAPSPVVEIPLALEVAPPREPAVTYDESSIKLTWTEGTTAQAFRVYQADAAGKEDGPPLNPAPLTTPAFSVPVEFGQQRCYLIRAVVTRGPATVESDAAGPACVTPVDTFPPAAPAGLSALPTETQVQLLWSAVTSPDLAGYLVLRGADGSKPEPLMAEPIAQTSYTDANVRAGVHYTYAVVAVDKAGNRSAPSNQIEEIR